MVILQLFDLIFYPIEKLLDLLKSQEISDYLFSGSMTLYSFIVVLICVFLVARFALKPVALRARFDSPVSNENSNENSNDLSYYESLGKGWGSFVDWQNKHR